MLSNEDPGVDGEAREGGVADVVLARQIEDVDLRKATKRKKDRSSARFEHKRPDAKKACHHRLCLSYNPFLLFTSEYRCTIRPRLGKLTAPVRKIV